MYVLPQWSQFGKAMEAVALGECGGTLTLQTKIGGTTPAPDPFRYQNSAVKDSADNPVALEPTVVTTNQQFTTGTFDFVVPNGQYVTVDVLPQNYSDLNSTRRAWSCRAGNQPACVHADRHSRRCGRLEGRPRRGRCQRGRLVHAVGESLMNTRDNSHVAERLHPRTDRPPIV